MSETGVSAYGREADAPQRSEASVGAASSTSDPTALSIRGLSFSYPAGEDGQVSRVLGPVDWEVPAGAFVLLVGDTGSGKSTLLSLVKPQIAPAGERTGRVQVFGRPVEELSDAESARTVGYVFQDPENQIVCDSVWHEMAFGLENLGVPQDEMRRLVAETSYFFGIDDWFRRDTATLSGGRKQLLALASTLVMQPRLLLLDEPTAQLDPIAEKNFLHALFRVNRELGCTVVVATHAPRAMVDYATDAVRLVDGRIERVANLDELRERPVLLGEGGGEKDGRGPAFQGADAPRPESASSAVVLERLWFRYDRDAGWVLRGLELAARPGIHALVGGNGCGKSTVLALMAGARKPQRGRVTRTASRTALLPQNPRALFVAESAIEELIEWSGPAGYTAADAHRMLERVGLLGCARQHPYDLSGGQQQMLALAKLLLIRPDLLLLDEPTKGLDAASRRKVAQVLCELRASGATVVLATHDLDFVEQVADAVSMVFDGEVACTASTEAFFRGNVYYRP